MKVVWSRRAIKHLSALRDYIAEDSPASAAKVAGKIVASVELLAKHPAIGRTGRIVGTRELIVSGTPYVIPYRLQQDHLELIVNTLWPNRVRTLLGRFGLTCPTDVLPSHE